jgi:hypothetical protein
VEQKSFLFLEVCVRSRFDGTDFIRLPRVSVAFAIFSRTVSGSAPFL